MIKKQHEKKENKEKQFFDKSYKYLFSHKKFIESLIRFALPDKLVRQINWKTLKSEKTDFVPRDLKRKEADTIYGIKLRNKESIYVFFLVEFQVTVEKLMALRLFIYIALFYHHLMKMGRIKKNADEIPVVIPIVLYIGESRWNAGKKLSALMNKEVLKIVKEYIPEIKYLLIDKNKYTYEELKKMKNAVTGLLYLEKIREADTRKHIIEFIKNFSKGTGKDQFNMLMDYLSAMIQHKYGKKIDIKKYKDEEVMVMGLATALDKWQEDTLQKGMQKGMQEGKLEGKIEDAKKMIEEGVDIPRISRITGLSKNQILKLKSSKQRGA